MRIAQVTAYFQPEFGYEEYYLSRTLSSLGHEVSLVTSDRIFPFKNVKRLLAEIGTEHTTRKRGTGVSDLDGFKVYRLPCAFEMVTDFNLIMNIRATLKKIRPDIVHIHEPIQGGSAFAALHKDLGFKLVVDQHTYATTFEETRSLKNQIAHYQFVQLRKRFARLALSRADAITAVTDRTKQFMVEVQKIPADNIEVVTLGVDVDTFKFNKAARVKIRKELGVARNAPLILTAGRLDRAKKLEMLIQAFSGMNKSLGARLVIIGSGDDAYERKLRFEVEKLDLNKSVNFIKFVNRSLLSDYYSAADIGFWNKASITILEAMNCRVPVVIPDQITIKRYVANKNGLLFPEGDVVELKECLTKLAGNNELRNEMAERGVKLVGKKYSYNASAKNYLKIYRRCLERS